MTHDRDPFAAAPPDLRELLALASDLALRGGAHPREGRRQRAQRIETKSSPTDLVSQIDREAERLIVERLREVRPDDALLARGGQPAATGTSGVRWVDRPARRHHQLHLRLPGLRRVHRRRDRRARRGSASSSTRAPGACTGRSPGTAPSATTGRSACASRPTSSRRWWPPASPTTAGAARAPGRRRWPRCWAASATSAAAATAALDLCHVAAGHVDAYWELDLSPWDYAAGALIAREAGAAVELAARGARARAGRGGRAPGADAGVPRAAARGGRAGADGRGRRAGAARGRAGSAAQRQQLQRMVDAPRARRSRPAPPCVRKPHEAPTAIMPGRRGGAHVDQRVAEVGDARRRQPEAGGDRQRDRRVGLERRVRPRAATTTKSAGSSSAATMCRVSSSDLLECTASGTPCGAQRRAPARARRRTARVLTRRVLAVVGDHALVAARDRLVVAQLRRQRLASTRLRMPCPIR